MALALFSASALAATNVTYKAALTLKETYDDNVFILDAEAYPGIVPPPNSVVSVPQKGSFVTTVTPSLGLSYRACSAFMASVSYAPDLVWYHSAHSEDYIAHRGSINFNGKIKKVTYDWLNSIVWVDGSDLTPTTLRPGDCRAIGGIPLRDRREQAIYKNGFKLTIPLGKWMIRPVVNTYVHDFQTQQHPNTNLTSFLYENYIDRWDVSAGLDVGYEVFENTKIVLGYRYGHQHQGTALGVPSPYSNDYQRFLAGIEGTPAKWLKLAVLAGPDVRDWDHATPSKFNRDELLWYVDGLVTVLPTDADTFTLRVTRYEQPAFTSQSVYEDIKYDLAWRHKFTDKFTAGIGFTAYIGDWQAPVNREDAIYTPSFVADYTFNNHVMAELSYSHDAAVSNVPNGPRAPYATGREFTRNLISLGVKYTF